MRFSTLYRHYENRKGVSVSDENFSHDIVIKLESFNYNTRLFESDGNTCDK